MKLYFKSQIHFDGNNFVIIEEASAIGLTGLFSSDTPYRLNNTISLNIATADGTPAVTQKPLESNFPTSELSIPGGEGDSSDASATISTYIQTPDNTISLNSQMNTLEIKPKFPENFQIWFKINNSNIKKTISTIEGSTITFTDDSVNFTTGVPYKIRGSVDNTITLNQNNSVTTTQDVSTIYRSGGSIEFEATTSSDSLIVSPFSSSLTIPSDTNAITTELTGIFGQTYTHNIIYGTTDNYILINFTEDFNSDDSRKAGGTAEIYIKIPLDPAASDVDTHRTIGTNFKINNATSDTLDLDFTNMEYTTFSGKINSSAMYLKKNVTDISDLITDNYIDVINDFSNSIEGENTPKKLQHIP